MSSINFPGSLDNGTSLPDPNPTDNTLGAHAALHTNENAAIRAIEAKLGSIASVPGAAGQTLISNGNNGSTWGFLAGTGGGGSGTVMSVSVASANGLAGTVANASTTPVITLTTSITGILKGNGTSLSAAVAADFPTLNQNTTGTASNITGTLAVSQGGTGATASTGAGSVVLSGSPTLTGTPTIAAAVATSLNVSGQITSTQTTGTAPLVVASTTNVTNLNADTVDGIHANATPTANQLTPLDATGRFDQSVLPLGSVVQVVSTNYSALGTTTTIIPFDDTIPQSTEGAEFMTQAITPKSTTNTLVISVIAMVSHSVGTFLSGALFQDAGSGAIAASASFQTVATGTLPVTFTHRMAAGTVASTTFHARFGGNDAGTLSFNGSNGLRRFGGITVSNITITEIKA